MIVHGDDGGDGGEDDGGDDGGMIKEEGYSGGL